ncbi:hypothetical protein BB560_007059 [Smittium megazygosporum]|uniref:SURP motif domain-containing protein n=1 Tax=Smittium megazygosporum TaxID=133381 RepID=A0A2T9XZ32_9FUNG|nr:hypothetical protein BB560_007059 [Smittium megazygosporum]
METATNANHSSLSIPSADPELKSLDSSQEKPNASIIYPPPEIRNIIDKTAEYVLQNGHILEQRIRETEKNNPKFSFLNQNDPYHPYYVHQLQNENLIQKIAPVQPEIPQEPFAAIPEEPEPFLFSFSLPTISAQDL